jgi:hypothetical protein
MQNVSVKIGLVALAFGLAASTSQASHENASPFTEDGANFVSSKEIARSTIAAFGDFGDFEAATLAGADHLVAMQADITEDNAGNGDPDIDLEDGGWDWYVNTSSHTVAASSTNLYGVISKGIYNAYQLDPKASYFIAMTDAANAMVANPAIRSAGDLIFLLNYSTLSGVTTPAVYTASAVAKWDSRIVSHGSPAGIIEAIRDLRHSQGYDNGIIPWDCGAWVEAAATMDAFFPSGGYDVDADDMAEVMWQDAFNGSLFNYFEPTGINQGYDPAWNTSEYWWYTLGITGLIKAFEASGEHTAELAGLETILLACQYPDGSFSDQYGAQGGDADWQTTGYAVMAMAEHLSGLQAEIDNASWLLTATQDPSGGFVYDDGYHLPTVSAECVSGMAYSTAYSVVQTPLYQHISVADGGSYLDTATLDYALTDGTFAYRSITVFVAYDAAKLTPVGITEAAGHDPSIWFDYNLNNNPIEVSLTILGPTSGITGASDLFSLTFDGDVEQFDAGSMVSISQVVMRDPDNGNIFASIGDDAEIDIDGTVPTLAVTFPGQPCINGDFDVVLDADDNINLDYIEYLLDGAWTNAELAIDGVSFDNPSFTVSVGSLTDGDYDIDFRCYDDVGYVSLLASWNFHLGIQASLLLQFSARLQTITA